MLAATARGVRGICEVRDAGLPVPLTDEGPSVHEVDLDEALQRNELARAILATVQPGRGRAAQPRDLRLLGDRLRAQQGALAQHQPEQKLDPEPCFTNSTSSKPRPVAAASPTRRSAASPRPSGFNGAQRQDLRACCSAAVRSSTSAALAHPSRRLSNNFLYWFKPRLAPLRRAGSRPRSGAPLLSPARSAPAAPTPAHMWIGPEAMSRAPDERGPRSQTMPPAGDRPAPGWRGRRSRPRAHRGERGGLPSRRPSTPGRAEQTRSMASRKLIGKSGFGRAGGSIRAACGSDVG